MRSFRTPFPSALQAKLDSGVTTLCRCWLITRNDGVTQGFTDHDEDVVLDAVTCRAGTGLDGQRGDAESRARGRRSELSGALADDTLNEDDLAAGRYDAAAVELWLVDWSEPDLRVLLAKGTLGEVRREGTAFTAELRGLEPSGSRRTSGGFTPRPVRPISAMRAARSISTMPAYRGSGTVTAVIGDLDLHAPAGSTLSTTAGSPPASSPSPAAPMPGWRSR